MSSDPDGELFNAVVESRLARMSDDDWHALVKRVRPPAEPAPPMTREQALKGSLTAKAGQLWDITQRCADGNGYTAGIRDAMTARDQPAPQPQQPEPMQPKGFSANRAQGASSDNSWAPLNERDRNSQKISDILNNRRI
jgi:hypothetical protein